MNHDLSQRDTQFRGFAKLEFDDVYWMFNNLFIEQSDCDYEKAGKTGRDIQVYLSRCAYDLVKHTLEFSEYEQPMSAVLPHVPDLTAWPEVQE